MENINKIAGRFIEAWAQEIFVDVLEDENNEFQLMNVEARERLHMADIVLQFKRNRKINPVLQQILMLRQLLRILLVVEDLLILLLLRELELLM